jgi:hypothetical protein
MASTKDSAGRVDYHAGQPVATVTPATVTTVAAQGRTKTPGSGSTKSATKLAPTPSKAISSQPVTVVPPQPTVIKQG